MAPRKTKKTLVNTIRELSPFKKLIAIAIGVGAVSTAIISGETAYSKIEPVIPLTSPGYVRGYVASHTKEKLTPFQEWQEEQEFKLAQQSLGIDRLNLTQQREYLIRAQKEQVTNKNSAVVREHIQQLEKDLDATKRRIEEAEKASHKRERK